MQTLRKFDIVKEFFRGLLEITILFNASIFGIFLCQPILIGLINLFERLDDEERTCLKKPYLWRYLPSEQYWFATIKPKYTSTKPEMDCHSRLND